MPRRKRIATSGVVFHVLNRAVARERIVWKPADYEAFETVLEEAGERVPIRLLCYSVMPNHIWCCGREAMRICPSTCVG
jgi:REP element-mobilizing transposase RayT